MTFRTQSLGVQGCGITVQGLGLQVVFAVLGSEVGFRVWGFRYPNTNSMWHKISWKTGQDDGSCYMV